MFGVIGPSTTGPDTVWNTKADYEVNARPTDVYVECYCCYYNP